MINQHQFFKYFFGYGVAIFPFLLLIGPLISEIFLILSVIFATYSIVVEKNYKYFNNKFFKFFSIFYLVILFSTLLNYHGFDNSKSAIFYFRIPLFAISIWYILDKFEIFNKKILIFYSLFFALIIIDSLIQYFTGKNIFGYSTLNYRISSFFGEELILGGFILRLIPFFLIYLIMNNLITDKKINYYCLCLLSFGYLIVYLSGERTSFFLLFLFFFTIYFINKNLRKFIIYSVGLFVLSAVTIPNFKVTNEYNPATRMFKKSYHQIIGKGEEQYEQHKKKILDKVYIFSHDHHGHYMLSFKIFKDHPFIGTGVKGFRYLCRNKVYILEKNDGCSTHPHNTYVQILVSSGLIGVSLLIFVLYYFVKEIFNNRKEINQKKYFDKYKVSKSVIVSAIFINLWPLIPSGNFFNNWLSMIYFYPIGFYFYFINEKIS